MFYIYSPKSAFRRVAKELSTPTMYPFHNKLIMRHRNVRLTHVVNVGCSSIGTAPTPDLIINKDIRLAISKVKTYKRLEECGIRCPRLLTKAQALQFNTPLLGRKDGLSGGRGIMVYTNGTEIVQEHDFYVPVIPCRREFRIHVFNKEIVAIQKKRIANAISIIHNHDNGVLFQNIPLDDFNIGARKTSEIKEMALAATQAVGLDFAAIDVLQEQGTNELFILEANSAPGISSQPIYHIYLELFRKLVIT